MDASAYEKLVETRRSIRLFDKTPVPPEIVTRCLDLALLSPNSSNLQPWQFFWVRTPATKAKLVEACLSQAAAKTAAELIVCVARTATWKRTREHMLQELGNHQRAGVRIPEAAWHYYRKLVPLGYSQGFLGLFGIFKRLFFLVAGWRKPMLREPKSAMDMKLWAVKSTALACQNLMMAFRAFDFDTCPMEGFDSRRVRKLLQLPSDATTVMVLAVGKRGPRGVTVPRIRGDRSWFVTEV